MEDKRWMGVSILKDLTSQWQERQHFLKKKGKKGRTFGAQRTRPANYGRGNSLDLGRGTNINWQNLHRVQKKAHGPVCWKYDAGKRRLSDNLESNCGKNCILGLEAGVYFFRQFFIPSWYLSFFPTCPISSLQKTPTQNKQSKNTNTKAFEYLLYILIVFFVWRVFFSTNIMMDNFRIQGTNCGSTHNRSIPHFLAVKDPFDNRMKFWNLPLRKMYLKIQEPHIKNFCPTNNYGRILPPQKT